MATIFFTKLQFKMFFSNILKSKNKSFDQLNFSFFEMPLDQGTEIFLNLEFLVFDLKWF